jgi:tetratricopeptide (TPR) repeat protein
MDLLRKAATISATGRTLIARAGVYAKLGRTDDAIMDLKQAIEWEPGNVDAHIALGDLLRDYGNIQAASAYYASAVRLNPGLGFGRLRVTRNR